MPAQAAENASGLAGELCAADQAIDGLGTDGLYVGCLWRGGLC